MMDHYLPQASTFARDIDQLVWLVAWLVGFWYVLAQGMFFWLMWRYRAKPGVRAEYVTGKEKHLKRWITIPHNIILVLDVVIIIGAIRVWYMIKQQLPPADATVKVMSQQWAWTFTDPGPDGKMDTADDIRTTDEMHVVVGKTYHFTLESKDVAHSFFVPAFRLKQDCDPGRAYTGWFKASQTGTFDISCAEICGIGHGVMGAKLVVETPEEHATWMAAHAADGGATAAATTTMTDSTTTTTAPEASAPAAAK